MVETNQQNNQNADNTAEKVRGVPFKAGDDPRRNLEGRPIGSKNFSTLFDAAIRKIIKEQKIPIEDPEIDLVVKAVVEALKGNYAYYRDIMDRRYGQAKQTIETSGETEVKLITKGINLYKILIDLNLDDATRERLNKKLLELADEPEGATGDGLPNRPLGDDRKGDLPAN